MRFIGLQRTDEMQFEAGMARFERRPFFQRFLDPVFAENPLTRADHGCNVWRGKGLGDTDEGHVFWIAFRIARGAFDTGTHQGEALDGGCGRFFGLLQGFGLKWMSGGEPQRGGLPINQH
jgi:hypothetical protein